MAGRAGTGGRGGRSRTEAWGGEVAILSDKDAAEETKELTEAANRKDPSVADVVEEADRQGLSGIDRVGELEVAEASPRNLAMQASSAVWTFALCEDKPPPPATMV